MIRPPMISRMSAASPWYSCMVALAFFIASSSSAKMALRASSSVVRASTFFTLVEKLRILSSDMTRLIRFSASTVWARTVPDPLSSSAIGDGWLQELEQLERLSAQYATRESFVTELTLDPPEATSDESGVPHQDEDTLILSTIHSAKGQEWKAEVH